MRGSHRLGPRSASVDIDESLCNGRPRRDRARSIDLVVRSCDFAIAVLHMARETLIHRKVSSSLRPAVKRVNPGSRMMIGSLNLGVLDCGLLLIYSYICRFL